MKHNNTKYLKALLGLAGWIKADTSVNQEVLDKALQWASGGLSSTSDLVNYRPVALRPALETLKGGESKHFLHPQALALSIDFFPKTDAPSAEALSKQVEVLKQALSTTQEEQLLTALEYYASTLAAGERLPDLPLYDYLKIAAAIAHCIENGNGNVRLAGGNISGIQDYLYDILSKRASKLLKGRSFYLQLLSYSLVETILEYFSLSPCHVVYSSGGGFYVLMPDNDAVKEKFNHYSKSITKKIYARHGTALFVDFALSKSVDQTRSADSIWDELFQGLNENKNKRFSDDEDILRQLLEGYVEHGGEGNAGRDEITNEEINDPKELDFIGTEEDRITVSKFTKGQIEKLGKNLRDANYWIVSKNPGFHAEAFEDPLGYWHLLADSMPKSSMPADAKIMRLNIPHPGVPFVFYGGNRAPVFTADSLKYAEDKETREGDPLTFDAMAGGKDLDRLGILRMDVDGLGRIFSTGIGTHPSFARYAAVSRWLDWFFKGWLNEIHKIAEDTTLIVYSGGDDLFIVGKWNDVFSISMKIHKDFHDWSCGNLTISGGLEILPAKFPVMQGAKLAGKSEERAKKYRKHPDGEIEKNALSILGVPLSWKWDMPVFTKMAENLKRMINLHYDSRSLLGRIYIHAMALDDQENHNKTPRWKWNLIYDLSRFEERLRKKNPEAAKIVVQLRDEAFEDEAKRKGKNRYHYLSLLHLAARSIELEIRTEGTENNSPN